MKFPAVLLSLLLSSGLARAAEIRLDDGTVLIGEIVARTDSTVVLDNPTLGRVTVPSARVVTGLTEPAGAAQRIRRPAGTDPAGYALFMLPTAFTPPARTFTFRDFELFFLTLGYSPTATTSLTAGTFFPVTGHFGILSLGGKQQIFNVDGTAAAVTGNMTIPLEAGDPVFNVNGVLSHRIAADGRADAFGVHAALGVITGSGESEGVFGFGAEARLTSHVKIIGEYVSLQEFSDAGLLNIGIRLHGERLSADISGIRPIGVEADEVLFIPLVIVNYRF